MDSSEITPLRPCTICGKPVHAESIRWLKQDLCYDCGKLTWRTLRRLSGFDYSVVTKSPGFIEIANPFVWNNLNG